MRTEKECRKGILTPLPPAYPVPAATPLVIIPPEGPTAALDPVHLLLADKRSPATRRAYQGDLTHFFGGIPSPAQVQEFVGRSTPQIALALTRYRERMLASNLAEATVNRRLSALRSLLKLCHRLGLSGSDGRGLVDSERVQTYRDTRGIAVPQLRRLLEAPGTEGVKALRDRAILLLLVENALRRKELTALDVGDADLKRCRIQIRGKGKGTQKEWMTVSKKAAEHLHYYLKAAGHRRGSLFRNLTQGPSTSGQRLSPSGLYALVQEYGQAIGERNLTPHKLRHSAITALLDATGGDVRKVRQFSRHADVRTLLIYDDARRDDAGALTDKLSDLLG